MTRNGAPYRLLRIALFAFLALVLVTRVGPICEAVAVAAVPSASAMTACEGAGHNLPEKKVPVGDCSMPCAVALDGMPTGRVSPLPFAAIAPWPARHSGLHGIASPPATPPPQTT